MKFLEMYQSLSVLKIKGEDTYGVAFIKGAINGVPILTAVGSVAHIIEKCIKKSKK